MKYALGFGAACLAVALVACVTGYLPFPGRTSASPENGPGSAPQVSLAIRPVASNGSDVVEGEHVEHDLTVSNQGNQSIFITAIATSCGCMNEFTVKGKPLALPLTVGAKSDASMQFAIDTTGRGGRQRFTLGLRYRVENEAEIRELYGETLITVRVPFIALPPRAVVDIDFNKVGLSHSIEYTIYDGWPGAGLGIGSITATSPERTSWELLPLSGEEVVGVTKLQQRFLLKVNYQPDANAREFIEKVTLTPDNPRASPLVLQFSGRVLRGVEVEPAILTWHSAAPSTVRHLFVRFRDPDYHSIKVIALPDYLSAEIRGLENGQKWVDFQCQFPEDLGKHTGEIILETEPKAQRLTIPVTVYVEKR